MEESKSISNASDESEKGATARRRCDQAIKLTGLPFAPGSAIFDLFMCLADEKRHKRSEVLSLLGVKAPNNRLDAVKKRGTHTGKWAITDDGTTLQMIVHDQVLRHRIQAGTAEPSVPHAPAIERLASTAAIPVLDLRDIVGGLISTTEDPKVAATFLALRNDDGTGHRGQLPADSVAIGCDLSYPPRLLNDGPVFVSAVMEDKWDIYLYNGILYFARSWTGTLLLAAAVLTSAERLRVSAVHVGAQSVKGDPQYGLHIVDFLIKTHLYGAEVPAPLPATLSDNLETIVAFSFSEFGRRAGYVTFGETL